MKNEFGVNFFSNSIDTIPPEKERIDLKRKGSKQKYAYQFIKDAIFEDRYPEGMKLEEIQLCEAMGGISRTPVRDALYKLCYEGIVVNVPGRGMFVAGLNIQDLIEITEARIPSEVAATELFIERATEKEKQELRDAFAEHEKAYSLMDLSNIQKNDNLFHHIIGKGTHNSRLSAILDSFILLTSRGANISYKNQDRVHTSLEEHRAILNAVLEGNTEKAVLATKQHRNSWINFAVITKLNLNYFKLGQDK